MENQNNPQKNQSKEKKSVFPSKHHGQAGYGHGQQRHRRPHKNQNARPKTEGADIKTENKNTKNLALNKNTSDKKVNPKKEFAQPTVQKIANEQQALDKKQHKASSQGRHPDYKSSKRKNFQKAETLEDIKRDLQRIEKEIWLEISDISSLTLD